MDGIADRLEGSLLGQHHDRKMIGLIIEQRHHVTVVLD